MSATTSRVVAGSVAVLVLAWLMLHSGVAPGTLSQPVVSSVAVARALPPMSGVLGVPDVAAELAVCASDGGMVLLAMYEAEAAHAQLSAHVDACHVVLWLDAAVLDSASVERQLLSVASLLARHSVAVVATSQHLADLAALVVRDVFVLESAEMFTAGVAVRVRDALVARKAIRGGDAVVPGLRTPERLVQAGGALYGPAQTVTPDSLHVVIEVPEFFMLLGVQREALDFAEWLADRGASRVRVTIVNTGKYHETSERRFLSAMDEAEVREVRVENVVTGAAALSSLPSQLSNIDASKYRDFLINEKVAVIYSMGSLAGARVAVQVGVPFVQNWGRVHTTAKHADLFRLRSHDCVTTAYLAPSMDSAFYWAAHYDVSPHKLAVVRPGIDTFRIDLARKSNHRWSLRAEFGVPVDELVFLQRARCSPTHGYMYAVHAFVHAYEAGLLPEKSTLIIVGPQCEHAATTNVPSHLRSRVIMVSARSDLADFYFAADVYVHTAVEEAATRVLLEALYAGLEVIAVDASSAREMPRSTRVTMVPPPYRLTDVTRGNSFSLLTWKDVITWCVDELVPALAAVAQRVVISPARDEWTRAVPAEAALIATRDAAYASTLTALETVAKLPQNRWPGAAQMYADASDGGVMGPVFTLWDEQRQLRQQDGMAVFERVGRTNRAVQALRYLDDALADRVRAHAWYDDIVAAYPPESSS